jgi:hypothetical protein
MVFKPKPSARAKDYPAFVYWPDNDRPKLQEVWRHLKDTRRPEGDHDVHMAKAISLAALGITQFSSPSTVQSLSEVPLHLREKARSAECSRLRPVQDPPDFWKEIELSPPENLEMERSPLK